MSKNFQTEILDVFNRQSQLQDPFIYATPQVVQFTNQLYKQLIAQFGLFYLASNVLVAPLQTVVTSLQLSVQKHRELHESKEAKTKELARLNTQMTVHDKRRFELMIRAGGRNIPYIAPVYAGYRETIQGLASQGWKAFFKGLGFRTFTSIYAMYPLYFMSLGISEQEVQQSPYVTIGKIYAACLVTELFLHPFHMMENRYILQSAIKQFRAINKPLKSTLRLMKQNQFHRGIAFQFFNCSVGLFTRTFMMLSLVANKSIQDWQYGLYAAGEFLLYPIATASKRMQCQTERLHSMIPPRYSGVYHALRVMLYEEGVKGLWRGFPLHVTANLLRFKGLEYVLGPATVKP